MIVFVALHGHSTRVHMKKLLWPLLVLLPALLLISRTTHSSPDAAARFRATTDALLEDIPGRLDRILALHAFVRDEIVEIPSQYG